MAVNEDFVAKLEAVYKLKKDIRELEAARATAYEEAQQTIAAKYKELETAEIQASAAAK